VHFGLHGEGRVEDKGESEREREREREEILKDSIAN